MYLLSEKEAAERLRLNTGFILDSNYSSYTKNAFVKCLSCGNIYERKISSLVDKKQKSCNACYSKRKTIRVRKSFDCKTCGKKVENKLFRKNSYELCKSCAIKENNKRKIHSYEKVKSYIESVNCRLLTTKEDYINKHNKIEIQCHCGNIFKQTYSNFHDSKFQCPTCSFSQINYRSQYEKEIEEFIKSLGFSVITNDRSLLGKEIDIYVPKKNIAIEFNGIYYHSTKHKYDPNYHLNKTEIASNNGIKMIHIFEDEWVYKRDIVKSIIKNKLGTIERKIPGRKCHIKEISPKQKKTFINENHIQGDCHSSINLGMYYDDSLVAVMTLGKSRFSDKSDHEIIRYCSIKNTIIHGAVSKFLNHIRKNYSITRIITYVDRRYGNGESYIKAGFKLIGITKPNYFYVIGQKRQNRTLWQKKKLTKKLAHFDSSLTEIENMEKNNYHRIFDCGNMKFALNITK